ncbi:hypothetical protein shim_21160 [Shimia sp. SK013]|nr:hypothetical protein shim_21160 [Shimia sp. SK013]
MRSFATCQFSLAKEQKETKLQGNQKESVYVPIR